METAFIGAIAALIGIVLGGGVRAWEASYARRKEAEALLSALVAEVEACTRLVNHRQFLQDIEALHTDARAMIDAGRGADPCRFLEIKLVRNYFAVFDASVGKLGLLHPYKADRIVRFYTLAKAALESYDPSSPHQRGVSAFDVAAISANDHVLLHTVLTLGNAIAGFRQIKPPRGISDPFGLNNEGMQPALPPSKPSEGSAEAGGTS